MSKTRDVLDAYEPELRFHAFGEVDLMLDGEIPENDSPEEILVILTITSYAKDKLSRREAYLERAERALVAKLGADRAASLLENRR